MFNFAYLFEIPRGDAHFALPLKHTEARVLLALSDGLHLMVYEALRSAPYAFFVSFLN